VPEQCRKHGVNSLIDVLSTNQLMTMLMMLTASANRRRQTFTEHRRYHSTERDDDNDPYLTLTSQ